MSLSAKDVAKMLIINGPWEGYMRERPNPPFPWMVRLDGITNASQRQELIEAFGGLLPSSKPRIFEDAAIKTWIIVADPIEVKGVQDAFFEQRDAEGFFTGKISGGRANRGRAR